MRLPFSSDDSARPEDLLKEVDGRIQERMDGVFDHLKSLASTLNRAREELQRLQHDVSSVAQQAKDGLGRDGTLEGGFRHVAKKLDLLHGALTQLENSLNAAGDAGERAVHEAVSGQSQKLWDRIELLENILLERHQKETDQRTVFENELRARLERLDATEFQQPPDEFEGVAVLTAWLTDIAKRLSELSAGNGLTGRAHLFVERLERHLAELQQISAQIEGQSREFWTTEGGLAQLDRHLFAPALGVSWSEVTSQNSTEWPRLRLRTLETAVINFRRRLADQLRRRHGLAVLNVVPNQSRFEPTQHETSDFYSRPTPDRDVHNLITAIEREGYALYDEDGLLLRVVRRAQVRRYVYDPNSAALDKTGLAEAISDETISDEVDTIQVNANGEHVGAASTDTMVNSTIDDELLDEREHTSDEGGQTHISAIEAIPTDITTLASSAESTAPANADLSVGVPEEAADAAGAMDDSTPDGFMLGTEPASHSEASGTPPGAMAENPTDRSVDDKSLADTGVDDGSVDHVSNLESGMTGQSVAQPVAQDEDPLLPLPAAIDPAAPIDMDEDTTIDEDKAEPF